MTREEFDKELDKTFPLNKASERANSWNCDRQIGANWAFELLYKPLPPAEGAEEIDDETIAWAAGHQCGTPFSERWIGFVKGAKWHRSLHSQQIADKMPSERLREEIAAYEKWRYGREVYTDEYLKSREK